MLPLHAELELNRRRWLLPRRDRLALLLAHLATCAVLLAFLLSNERLWHWFVVPVLGCGLLIGHDLVRWLRGSYDIFDPKGLVGAYGWYFFFLAPLLFVHWNLAIPRFEYMPDWRPWVGQMATLNLAGLCLYQLFQRLGYATPTPSRPVVWIARPRSSERLILLAALLSLLAQLYYFVIMGGVAGIVATHTYKLERAVGAGTFRTLGGAFTVIALIYLLVRRRRRGAGPASLAAVLAMLAALTAVLFVFSGLTGSRSSTLTMVFWMAGIVHYSLRPFRRSELLVGLLVILAFLYLYQYYAVLGSDSVDRLAEGESIGELEEETGLTSQVLFIEDLSRASTQSYQLYRLTVEQDYVLRQGRTYLGSFANYIPTWIWPAKPPDPEKRIAGTELLYGPGVYRPGDDRANSSRVYGLLGEALLNFSPILAPLPFALWGFLMGLYRRRLQSWSRDDTRLLLAPYLTLLFTFALTSDLDDLVANVLFRMSPVIIVVLLISLRDRPLYRPGALHDAGDPRPAH